jgi:hypothetical protein
VSIDLKPQRKLSATEQTALRLLQEHGGSLIEWRVPEINEKDPVFGTTTPGMPVYRKLERMGLVFFTEEEPFDLPGDPLDGFQFSSEIYITDEGKALITRG